MSWRWLAYWHHRQFEISFNLRWKYFNQEGKYLAITNEITFNTQEFQTQRVINNALSKMEDGVKRTKAFQEMKFT